MSLSDWVSEERARETGCDENLPRVVVSTDDDADRCHE